MSKTISLIPRVKFKFSLKSIQSVCRLFFDSNGFAEQKFVVILKSTSGGIYVFINIVTFALHLASNLFVYFCILYFNVVPQISQLGSNRET